MSAGFVPIGKEAGNNKRKRLGFRTERVRFPDSEGDENVQSENETLTASDWKKRAVRAERLVLEMVEDKHKRQRNLSRRGFMRKDLRPRLKDSLDLLTNDDHPLEREVGVEYIVLRRLNKAKDWVQADFVDGDEEDDKE